MRRCLSWPEDRDPNHSVGESIAERERERLLFCYQPHTTAATECELRVHDSESFIRIIREPVKHSMDQTHWQLDKTWACSGGFQEKKRSFGFWTQAAAAAAEEMDWVTGIVLEKTFVTSIKFVFLHTDLTTAAGYLETATL